MDLMSKVNSCSSMFVALYDSDGNEVLTATYDDVYMQSAPPLIDCEDGNSHLVINLENADISYDETMDFYEIDLEGMEYQIRFYD